MVLNDREIQQRINSAHLLSNHDTNNLKNCGYTLRAGKVFQPETGEEELLNTMIGNSRALVWEIGPSETLVVRTKEKVKMPDDLCGTYAPLYHLSSRGVMLLNASIVEPGYEGPLSCFLVNFSSERISLEPDAQVAKILFHQLSAPPANPKPQTIEDQRYEAMLAVSAKKFHKSFMDITGVEGRAVEKARDAVRRWVVIGGILIAFLLLWASLEPLLSKWLWERTGIYTTTQRVEDTRLLKDLEAAHLKAEIERLKAELQNVKSQKELKGS